MRENIGIFRGKRIDNGEWVEGTGIFSDGINTWLTFNEPNMPIDFGLRHFRVDPNTIGECTGLKANGKLIFEGDILKFNYIGKNRGVEGIAAVEYHNGKFGVLWGWHRDFVPLDGFANTTIEIIGNVTDNPELLKGGEG